MLLSSSVEKVEWSALQNEARKPVLVVFPDGDSLPTPTYNSSILGDMFLEKKSNLLKNRLSQWEGLPDALILLKVQLQ